jgi:outer membrane protein assembly factor BamB
MPAPRGGRLAKPHHAIAAGNAVFVSAVIGDAPALIQLTRDGEPVWVFDSRVDISHAHWPLLAHDHVVLHDDGLYIVDRLSGSKLFDCGLDSWGQVIADASRLYLVNERHVDGPLVRVGAFDSTGQLIWQQNVAGAVRDDVRDAVGAIALDEGTLYQAADYRYTGLTGLFAFDATTGNSRWTAIAHPVGGVSAGRSNLYLVEKGPKDAPALLTARAQASGDVRWSSPVRGHDGAAPALVENLVLTFSLEARLDAWDADSGQPVWTRSFPSFAAQQIPNSTHAAAALGSSTIVVTAGSTLAVLSAEDGRELWSEDLANRGLGPVHSPIVANGRVYVVGDKEVVAFDCAPNAP